MNAVSLPRGIPAASLKPRQDEERLLAGAERLPRGIPAASLKPRETKTSIKTGPSVFRGEYPRPH